MSRAIRAQLNQVVTAVKQHGATIPKSLSAALVERDRLDAAAADYRQPRPDFVADLMAAALLEGRDPFDIDEVRQLGLQSALASTGMETRIGEAGDRRLLAAITRCADEVVSSLKAVADEAGEKLTNARQVLGDLDLGDSGAILQLGPGAAQAFLDAKASLKTVDDMSGAWFALATATRLASPSTPAVLRMSDAPLAVFERLQHKCGAWDVVVAGGTIDLATFDNAAERVARIQDERAARDAAAPTVGTEYKRKHGAAA